MQTSEARTANFFVDIYEGPNIGWEVRNVQVDYRYPELGYKGMTEQEARAAVEGERRPWLVYQVVNGEHVSRWEGGQSEADADHDAWIASVPR